MNYSKTRARPIVSQVSAERAPVWLELKWQNVHVTVVSTVWHRMKSEDGGHLFWHAGWTVPCDSSDISTHFTYMSYLTLFFLMAVVVVGCVDQSHVMFGCWDHAAVRNIHLSSSQVHVVWILPENVKSLIFQNWRKAKKTLWWSMVTAAEHLECVALWFSVSCTRWRYEPEPSLWRVLVLLVLLETRDWRNQLNNLSVRQV